MANQKRKRAPKKKNGNNNVNLNQLVAAISRNNRQRQPPRRKPQQQNLNKALDQKIAALTDAVSKLAVSTAPKQTNQYRFFRSDGESVPSMPHPPSLETDCRLRASQIGMLKMAADIRSSFLSGAGEFTLSTDGKVAYHLNFLPLKASDIKPIPTEDKNK
uniref:Nucleoprotein n=1 Tax=Guangdong chinese water snake torovirus TaxID=2116383 RepID=A0A2P1GNN4_9NIDO|nr:hypothetical protein [Guangdong chinese water snake torovirus]